MELKSKKRVKIILILVLTVLFLFIIGINSKIQAANYTSKIKTNQLLMVNKGAAWWTYTKHTNSNLSSGTQYLALLQYDVVKVKAIEGNWLKVEIILPASETSKKNFQKGKIYYIYYGSTASNSLTVIDDEYTCEQVLGIPYGAESGSEYIISSNPGVVKISGNKVEGLKVGTSNCILKKKNGKYHLETIKVVQEIKENKEVYINEKLDLRYYIKEKSNSNPDIAKFLDGEKCIKGLKEGTTKIVLENKKGGRTCITVKVKAKSGTSSGNQGQPTSSETKTQTPTSTTVDKKKLSEIKVKISTKTTMPSTMEKSGDQIWTVKFKLQPNRDFNVNKKSKYSNGAFVMYYANRILGQNIGENEIKTYTAPGGDTYWKKANYIYTTCSNYQEQIRQIYEELIKGYPVATSVINSQNNRQYVLVYAVKSTTKTSTELTANDFKVIDCKTGELKNLGDYYQDKKDGKELYAIVKFNPNCISKIEISGAKSVKVSETIQLTATAKNTEGINTKVIWSSNNTKVTVDNNGKVTGKSVGTATITAKTINGKQATYQIEVGKMGNIQAQSITETTRTITTSTQPYLRDNKNWVLYFHGFNPVAVKTDNAKKYYTGPVAIYNIQGIITGKDPGVAKIAGEYLNSDGTTNAGAIGYKYKTYDSYAKWLQEIYNQVLLGRPVAVKARQVEGNNPDIYLIAYGVRGTQGGRAKGKLAASDILVIDTVKGTYTDLGKYYEYKDNNNRYALSENPNIDVTGIKMNKSTAQINVGGTVTLTATIQPSNATNKNVTWSTSNSKVATVSGGKVTGKSAGTVTITAKSNNGKTATCTVTVKANSTPVSNGNSYIFIGDSRTVGMVGRVNSSLKGSWDSTNGAAKSKIQNTGKIVASHCVCSMGYDYFFNNQSNYNVLINSLKNAPSGTKIVVLLGVNDLGNVNKYANKLNSLANTYTNLKFYFVSVTYINESLAKKNGYSSSLTNAKINTFNSTLKSALNSKVKYIDVNSSIGGTIKAGTTDGIHYNSNTYIAIWNEIYKRL